MNRNRPKLKPGAPSLARRFAMGKDDYPFSIPDLSQAENRRR
jgi:hypothetical protein